jgi:hypothetical protein
MRSWEQKLQQVIELAKIARELAATSRIWAETEGEPKEILVSIDIVDASLKTASVNAKKLIDLDSNNAE